MFGHLRSDFPASLVVFFVAVPLCLGIALASGAPVFAGIISGIVGGIIVGLISGSSVGVSGPAAGLAVIVLSAIQDLGAYPVFLTAVVVSGILQIVLGLVKAGFIGYFFPNSVIKGMLSAIGVIIILKQIPHAFGYDKDPEGDLEFFQPDGENTFSELFHMLNYVNKGAVIIFTISLAVLILWNQPFIKKIKASKIIQGPLVVVILGIIINQLFKGTDLFLGKEHLVSLPVAGNASEFFNQFTLFDPSAFLNPKVLIVGATIALVGSLETLLSVEATDKLDPEKRITPTNRELIAQGVGNIFSGMIGGLPVTQVIVRSSANIQSGNETKMAAILHGVMLLVAVIFIPHVLNMIPLSALAAVLIVVGFKLAKPTLFRQMLKVGMTAFIPFIITLLGIIFTDLLIGILLGLAAGVVELLYTNFKSAFAVKTIDEHDDHIFHLEMSENVSFLNKASVIDKLAHIPDGSKVIIDTSRSKFIHTDIREILDDFKENAEHRSIDLELIK